MTGPDAAAYYAALYAPTREDLCKALPEAADVIRSQLCELSARPTPDGCDRLSISLAGLQSAVRKLHEALIREGSDGR